jgi:hypothetical protein
MNESEAIEKNMEVGTGKNAYKAISEATILNMIKPLFKKYELIIFPISGDIKDHCMTWDKTDYDGKTSQTLRAMTELKVTYRILDIESGEFQDVVGFGNGADSQDKGAGKAFTYSLKNVLSKTFMLFSGEDTDNEHSDDIGKPSQTPQKPPQQSKPVQTANNPPAKNKPDGGSEKASKEQVKAVFAAGRERKERFPDFDMFQFIDKQADEGKISTKWTYADKEKTKINWTLQDIEVIMDLLELPF